MKKAELQAALLRSGGIFKNKIHTKIVLMVWKSRITPVLENGMNWHAPDVKLARKVDLFLRRQMRSLFGVPRYTPNEDFSSIFQFSSLFDQWSDLNARFINNDTKISPQAKST